MTAMNESELQKPEPGDRTQERGLLHHATGISETSWQIILLALSVAVVLFSVYCLSQGITIIFMHLYYLPIVLLAFRYRYKGFVLSVVISLIYICLVLFYSTGQNEVIIGALFRFVVFIGIAAVVAYLSDQIHKSRKSLKEVADIQKSSLMNANVWLMLLDRRGSVLLWNNAAERISGYSAAEVTGSNNIWKLLYPDKDYRAAITKKIERIIAEESFFENLETTIRTRSGEEKVISWNTRSLPGTSEQEDSYIAIGIEITERKRVEEELVFSERKFAAAFQASPDPIAISVIQTGKILDINRAFEDWSGYLREEMSGKTTRDLNLWVYPEERDSFVRILKTQGYVHKKEVTFRIKQGEFRNILFSAKVLETGDNAYMLSLAEDITERKRAEDALLRVNQKLNVLSQLTRKELANQIFVLNSYLELAKNQLAGQDHIIETVQKGVKAIQSIHETIEYSKDYQDMGEKPPKWQNVKMAFLMGLSHISIGKIQHSLETENLEIFADPLLEKVCRRLFENSVKHGDHVTRIRVWHTITPEGVTISFEDDGIGIPQEQKEQIFLRREGSGRTSMRSLIFVREILDITGIMITETGEPGKGARFEITISKGAWRIAKNGG